MVHNGLQVSQSIDFTVCINFLHVLYFIDCFIFYSSVQLLLLQVRHSKPGHLFLNPGFGSGPGKTRVLGSGSGFSQTKTGKQTTA